MADSNNSLNNQGHRFMRAVHFIIIIFYMVGIAGMLIPSTSPLFVKLTPLALMMGILLTLYFHPHRFDGRTLLIFLFIIVAGFFTEVAGVQTGLIFGHYYYGEGLGIRLFETPLLIGVNWLFMVWASSAMVQRFRLHLFPAVFIPSMLMVIYDLVMEQVAGHLDMWHWEDGRVPWQNYLAWFILALFFHVILKISRIRTTNNIAPLLFVCQFCFFLAIWLYNIVFR